MKNSKSPILLVLLILSFFYTVQAQDMYKVTADKLNVRESQDPTSKKIGFVPQNENVQVLDSTDAKYFKIKVTNGEGWVSKDYLQRVSPVPAVKPESKVATPITQPEVVTDHSNTIFMILVVCVVITLLFLIIKFLANNKILMAISIIIVVAIAYLCLSTFFIKQTISGKFTSDRDNQFLTFNFKSADSVEIEDIYLDTIYRAKYTIEGDMIKMKQQENIILLMIINPKTLAGEGFTKGIYNKN